MKSTYYIFVILVFMLMSCSGHEESVYLTKFHSYHWDVESNPLVISSSEFDRVFVIEDTLGNPGGIIGVTGVLGIDQQDTLIINNTALKDGRNSIKSDTLNSTWFKIINEREGVKVVLNENVGREKRLLEIEIWSTHIEKTYKGQPACGHLTIIQNPPVVD